ncbi:protein-glutamine gamma-glutamyltransferase [Paenibacillus senegalensis]|uniref:protein-glutamine gamma-glutamyltransferase n=1 Tax=Paenibacillus senegalensis TaxID=1465766 RepID=UPI000288F8B1|nr:protein-glutamine gamma-glutamyltransferase [Paenibacillus senegalensis]
MISIAGTPVGPNQLQGTWAMAGYARQILSAMIANSSNYSYPNLSALQFEVNLRNSIMQTALELGESGASFADFPAARCNEAYWMLTSQGGFLLRPSVPPAAAIRDIYQNGWLYAFECATAIIIIYYKAVLNVLPDPLFNSLFSDLYLYSWEFDKDLGVRTVRTSQFVPGDVLYFDNPDVNPATIEWQGVNVVDLSNGQYFGHGIGVRNAAEIIRILNENRRWGASRSAYLMSQATNPDYHYLFRVSGQNRRIIGQIGSHRVQVIS